MRKRYKSKLRSCGLCKPHKRGMDQRWKPGQGQALTKAERDIYMALHTTQMVMDNN